MKSEEIEALFLTEFKGIREHIDHPSADDPQIQYNLPMFPVLETFKDNIFFSFGLDWMYRDYLFPAYYIPNTDEMEYALKVISAFFINFK